MVKDKIDTFFDWVKDAVRDKMKNVLWALLTIAFTWIVATWKKGEITYQKYVCLPAQVDSVIMINKKILKENKEHDSIDFVKDLVTSEKFLSLHRQLDSTKLVVKEVVSWIMENDKKINHN